MSETELVRPIEATESGETVRAYVIPDGFVCVLIPEQQAEQLEDWKDCTAVRMALASDDGTVAFLEIEGTP
jgi:hypothetical protein